MRVAVTGSSGLIGTALIDALGGRGDDVVRIVRPDTARADADVRWDIDDGSIETDRLEGVDAIVHLAGVGIGDRRWNAAHKQAVLDSRVRGTRLVAAAAARLERRPAVLVCASAVGYYGDRGDEVLTEASASGDGFLAAVCHAWEAAAAPARDAGVRTAHVRSGIVLARHGGALPKMLTPFRFGVGGRLGHGRQWMSWISLADEVGAICHVLDHDVAGPVNATAPTPVTNREFTVTLGRVLRRPAVLPVPAAALKVLLGAEMANELLLAGQRAVPERLAGTGYTFAHTDLDAALRDVLGR